MNCAGFKFTLLLLGSIVLMSCAKRVITSRAPVEYVEKQLKKLAPVQIEFNSATLNENEIKTLKKLIEAAKIIDRLFLLQVYNENPNIQEELLKSRNPNDKPYLELFNIMFGPWNRIDHDRPFINSKQKPLGAAFYPEDMTKDEFLNHMKKHPEDKEAFESNFTVIRRKEGKLVAIPYHEYFKNEIEKLTKLLKEVATITTDSTLRKYLTLRANALLTDDYYESDLAWMDLSGNLEVVIGPYEVYEDRLFGYKAAYEAFICVVDKEESEKLKILGNYLDELESNLPIPDEYKNFSRGKSSPIKVVNEVFSAGDTKAGIQTTAFNLPNGERVRKDRGSKKVMLKNIAKAKYDKCWIPIVKRILADKPLKNTSFDAYFNHVLMHEISHGLGPGFITMENGEKTTVSKALKDLYPTIEECKADILGIYNLLYLIDKNVIKGISKYEAMATYLGGMYRSIRFGINEAHGGGVAIQFNYLMEKGAIFVDDNGKLDLNETKMQEGIRDLAKKVLTIEAKGNYAEARKLIEKYRRITSVMDNYLKMLEDLPIDIRPIYPEI